MVALKFVPTEPVVARELAITPGANQPVSRGWSEVTSGSTVIAFSHMLTPIAIPIAPSRTVSLESAREG
jgi:hypothetical protein